MMRFLLELALLFTALTAISGTPHNRNGHQHKLDDGPGPNGPPSFRNDGPGPNGPPSLNDGPGPNGPPPPIRNDGPGPNGPPSLNDGPGPNGPPSLNDGPGPNGPPPAIRNDGPGPNGPPSLNDGPGPNGPSPPILNDSPGANGPLSILDNSSEDEDMVIMDDMIVPKKMLKREEGADIVTMKRQAFNDEHYRWPKVNGHVTVPYTTSGVDSKVLQRAIEVFNSKTCVRFVPRSSQANYLTFQSGSSCNTVVGNRKSGKQILSLSSGCASRKGKVLHEMMHTLGFLHEQCRSDRDSYITIHTDRIMSGAAGNFAVFAGKDMGIPYDCDSILQYPGTAFAASSGQETITSTHCSSLGNGDKRLSLLDYKRVNKLYGCDPNPVYKYYKVQVVTDSSVITGSGTDCFIYLTLHGESGLTSTEYELDLDVAGSSNLFEAGSTDTFNYMAYRNDLGTINGISIRMVSNGGGEAWWPNTFTVTDLTTNAAVTFTNNQWLSPSSTYASSSFPTQ